MKQTILPLILFLCSYGISTAQSLPTIKITYDGNHANINVPSTITDVDATVNGANVEITSSTTTAEYLYEVSGQSDEGSLTITGNYKLSLRLNGVALTNTKGAAIDIECGKRIAVELAEGSVNTLEDGIMGTQKAALYFTGHPEFEGGGTLNVTGNTKHAISAKEYLQLKKSTGTINILSAKSDGIHCGKGKVNNEHNYFEMKGGVVNIANVDGDGIDSDDYGTVQIKGGAVNITVDGNDACGVKADSLLTISGGLVNITVNGQGSTALKSNYATDINSGEVFIMLHGDGDKGVKCKTGATTVLNGGNFNMSGGNLEIFSLGMSLIEAEDTTKCMGISIDKDFNQTGGDIHVYAYGPEAYAYKVKGKELKTDGSFNIVRGPWSMNPTAYQYDMSSFIVVNFNDVLIDDYSNYAVGAFIDDNCVGVCDFSPSQFGILRIHNDSASEAPITFKLYDYDNETEYLLTADRDVTFKSLECYGEPSTPVILSVTTSERLRCDVNEDGFVDISDIVAVINHIAGTNYYRYADVNDDKTVDISDIVSIINYIASM